VERKGAGPPILTFNRLLVETSFVDDMKDMLVTLKTAYDHPVDVEFTTNFFDEDTYRINLLQCRPLEVKEGGPITDPPEKIEEEDLILDARGAVIGYSRLSEIDRFIYIIPEAYSRLPIRDRYSLARLIGTLTRTSRDSGCRNVMLMGPGRWGTATPALGIPVSFSQVSAASVLCEIVTMRDGIVPDVSLGTHFFNDLVEADILYLALFPSEKNCFLNETFLERCPNKLAEIVPSDAGWSDALRVIDPRDFLEDTTVKLNANTFKQRVVCYLER
jgi:hypothetical protein